MNPLPIDIALPALRSALAARTGVVLHAPPGAGKTTRVPLALLDEAWLGTRAIVMLEPRRVAARAGAHRMAALLGEPIGDTIGFRVRSESRVSARTRIEVVTEGVLTRMIQEDPALERIGLVIFDEFHERSLQADLGLALCLQARDLVRDDLRLLVMSATLDVDPLTRLLGSEGRPAPLVSSPGSSFPVEVRFLPRPDPRQIEAGVTRAVMVALRETRGDVLAFLPGAGEIARADDRLRGLDLGPVEIVQLHGSLPLEAQDRALRPGADGRRRVVLATSIAETSLTIEGVEAVVDSGLMRIPRFSPRVGMTRLETVFVSRASAEQRKGRAGRLGPGTCYRLWSEAEDRGLVPHTPPEILSADLAPLALDLAIWGTRDPGDLAWLDPPPNPALRQAAELLAALGAIDGSGTATPHGREMAAAGVHPRLAHMVLRGRELGMVALACEIAALLSERDPIRGEAAREPDLRVRLGALRARGTPPGADPRAVARIRREASRLRSRLGIRPELHAEEDAGLLLSLAYPDRVAARRGDSPRYLLSNGTGATLDRASALRTEPLLAVAEVDGPAGSARIRLAAPLAPDSLETALGSRIQEREEIRWEADARAVRARRVRSLGALTLGESALPEPDPGRVREALISGIRSIGLQALPLGASATLLRRRVECLRRVAPEWPDLGEAALLQALEQWLGPALLGVRRLDDLSPSSLEAALLSTLHWRQRQELDREAPTHLTVPSGSRIAVDYADPERPILPVRLQEMFGATETPTIAWGRVPLTLHLLSPAHRPVQVTRDLPSFWRTAYHQVRKDLRGRYPKHHWPDDPTRAEPTRRTRPRT